MAVWSGLVALLGLVASGPLWGVPVGFCYFSGLLGVHTALGCPGDRGIDSRGSFFAMALILPWYLPVLTSRTLRRAFIKLQMLGEPPHEAAVGAHASRICGIGYVSYHGGGH